MVSQWFDRRRGFAMGLMVLGFPISMAVHPPLCQWLIDLVGWRQTRIWLGPPPGSCCCGRTCRILRGIGIDARSDFLHRQLANAEALEYGAVVHRAQLPSGVSGQLLNVGGAVPFTRASRSHSLPPAAVSWGALFCA